MRVKSVEDVEQRLACPHQAVRAEVLRAVASVGALLKGHFELQSGLHSRYFLRYSDIGWNTGLNERMAELLVEQAGFVPSGGAAIVCPETAGFFLAEAIAKQTNNELCVLAVDARRRPTSEFRTQAPPSDRPVVIVNDIATSGTSLQQIIDALGDRKLIGVLHFCVRSADAIEQVTEKHAMQCAWLVSSTWRMHALAKCPQCSKDEELLFASEFN